MCLILSGIPHINETIFADIQFADFPEFLGIRRKVPGVNLETSDPQLVNVLDLSDGLVLFLEGGRGRVHFRVRLLHMIDLVVSPLLVARNLTVTVLAQNVCRTVVQKVAQRDVRLIAGNRVQLAV